MMWMRHVSGVNDVHVFLTSLSERACVHRDPSRPSINRGGGGQNTMCAVPDPRYLSPHRRGHCPCSGCPFIVTHRPPPPLSQAMGLFGGTQCWHSAPLWFGRFWCAFLQCGLILHQVHDWGLLRKFKTLTWGRGCEFSCRECGTVQKIDFCVGLFL